MIQNSVEPNPNKSNLHENNSGNNNQEKLNTVETSHERISDDTSSDNRPRQLINIPIYINKLTDANLAYISRRDFYKVLVILMEEEREILLERASGRNLTIQPAGFFSAKSLIWHAERDLNKLENAREQIYSAFKYYRDPNECWRRVYEVLLPLTITHTILQDLIFKLATKIPIEQYSVFSPSTINY